MAERDEIIGVYIGISPGDDHYTVISIAEFYLSGDHRTIGEIRPRDPYDLELVARWVMRTVAKVLVKTRR